MAELSAKAPTIAIVMGSQSDWQVMKEAAELLDEFELAYEKKIVSAHRTPERLYDYGRSAQSRGLKIILAGAGGAAHLPGMLAAITQLPVLGVPITTPSLSGLDSLLSIAQMPKGVPVGTLALQGAMNAALLALRILALSDEAIAKRLALWIEQQTSSIAKTPT